MSFYMLPYAMMQLPAGFLSDQFGKKYFIVFSIFGTCLFTVLMAFAKTFEILLVLRILSGLTAGFFYAPSIAYVVQSASSKNIGMALGLVFTGCSVASIVISLLVNFFPLAEYGWRPFFLLSAVPGVLIALLLLVFIRDDKEELQSSRGSFNAKSFLLGLKNPLLIMLFIHILVSSLSGWSLMTFLPTFFVSNRGFTIAEASLIMIIYYATSILSGFLAGAVIRKIGLKMSGLITAVTMCFVSYAMPLSNSWVALILVLSLWGMLGGLSWPAYNILLSNLAPQGFQGTFLGIYNLMGFVSGTIGPVIFGTVADIAGFQAFFTASFLLYLITLGISIIIMRSRA